jgi:hypothetical protein
MSGAKFSPGALYATPGVLESLRASGDDILAYLVIYLAGDWGEVGSEDWRANEESLPHRRAARVRSQDFERHEVLGHQ